MQKVLYVEDDRINGFVVRELLKRDYDIIIANEPTSCLELWETTEFDMVLMDINLGPGQMDGIELMKTLRARPDYRQTPFIAVTAYALPGDRERFLDLGFDDYVPKPINQVKLRAAMRSIFDRHGGRSTSPT